MIPAIRPYEPWTYRLLFISFFLPMHVQTWLLIILPLCWLLIVPRQKIQLSVADFYPIAFMALSFLLYVYFIPLTETSLRSGLYGLIERKASLILLPAILLMLSRTVGEKLWKEIPWFVFANVLAGLLGNLLWIFPYLGSDKLQYLNHVDYRTGFEQQVGIHPTYFGMFCCWSLCLLLFHPVRIPLWLNLMCRLLLFLFLILLAPKMALITCLLILLYDAWHHRKTNTRPRRVIQILMGLGVGVLAYAFLPFFQQRIDEVLQYAGWLPPNGPSNSMDYRSLILSVDLNLLREHWLWGLGPMGLQQQLDLAFWHASVLTGIPLGTYNTHNELINQWLSFGLPGLLLFLFQFGYFFFTALRRHAVLYLMLISVIFLSCLTENILSRQYGVLFFAIFIPLCHYSKEKLNQEGSGLTIRKNKLS